MRTMLRSAMTASVTVAVACAALLLASCDADTATSTLGSNPAAATEPLTPTATVRDSPFGSTATWADGVTVTVSVPRSVRPSASAYPKAPRAAVFDVVLQNDSSAAFQSALVVVQATAGGKPLAQIVDSAQGLPTSSGTSKVVPAGGTIRLTVGFAMAAKQIPVRLTVQRGPDVSAGSWSFSGAA